MEEQNNQQSQEEAIQQIYKYAANLLFEQKKSDEETKECLIKSGLTPEDADYVINELNTAVEYCAPCHKECSYFGATF